MNTTMRKIFAAAALTAAALAGAGATTTIAAAETMSQHVATQAAGMYLKVLHFSHDGLITQLEYDKYSTDDATYAADHVNADWNAQAAAKAQDYVRILALSKPKLIAQLEYDKFTISQADYGADAAYRDGSVQ